jgi:hypothetical protein
MLLGNQADKLVIKKYTAVPSGSNILQTEHLVIPATLTCSSVPITGTVIHLLHI